MKLRNQLLALFCLLVFIGLGVLYVRTWVVQKPFAIILFVGDGMVADTLVAARIYEGGADHRLTVEKLPHTALLSNHANDFAVPDSAAAATALATGRKVNNRNLSMDADGNRLSSLLELARREGRSVGVVSNANLTDPGAAAFYAHTADFRETESIALQLGDAVDVALGGGAADFLSEAKGGRRKDGRDVLTELQEQGREVVRSKAELENLAPTVKPNAVGFFGNDRLAFTDEAELRAQQPRLADLVRRAIELLQYNRAGYVLVVDAGLITRAAERNEGERAIRETVELDHAVATALRYAGDDALIVATGKHGTGGMTLNGYPLRQEHGVALLGTTASGSPSITWSTGPGGPPSTVAAAVETGAPNSALGTLTDNPEVVAAGSKDLSPGFPKPMVEAPVEAPKNEPAAFYAPVAINQASDVIAVGIGRGSERLKGFMDNTQIFEIVQANL